MQSEFPPLPRAHDPDEIVKSQVFVAINLLIDQCRDSLLNWQYAIRGRMIRLTTEPAPHGAEPMLYTRVSREEGGRNGHLMLFSPHDLKELTGFMERARQEEHMIHELMRFKLRLLNDVDFSSGLPFDQIAVFGPPPEADPSDFYLVNFGEELRDDAVIVPVSDAAKKFMQDRSETVARGFPGVRPYGIGYVFGKLLADLLAAIEKDGLTVSK